MTQPPPSGPWGSQPPQQPGNWQGYAGGQPGPQGQWNPPQQQWPNPTPAPKKQGPLKWILGAIALIAVIAVTAVVAVSCAGGKGTNNANGGGGSTPTSGARSDIASANDTGPVAVITEDPSCAPWGPINDTLADTTKNGGWSSRDTSIPASAWTPEMQAMYQAAADAFRKSADQTVPLIKITTHRVMRELYGQYIAYLRAFTKRVPNYTPNDNNLIATGITFGMVISAVCQAITFGSAAARGPLISAAQPPATIAPIGDINEPAQVLTSSNPVCGNWNMAVEQFVSDPTYLAWNKEDPSIPAGSWPPQYKAENDSVRPALVRLSDSVEQLGRESKNPTIEDLGVLAAQYGRAFIQGIGTYTSADAYLFNVMWRTAGAVSGACKAVGTN
ncbi:hypothetical protein FZI85_25930 [Mycobacterium sp. CBMA293]|uniref:hypothetical protein n=1 Tax=unclassified Mycolicibacterium TaxID=2636767 RepID=UPI0012DCEB1E|nr:MULTISPECIES: hypothetical protein [unclassified Mycolicibacterium]MUL47755.1 hypothetical protein [Mycolicibacterium sp. CBMA 360]MUL61727.1 hypothetical protein [Mycolicibacterium sp. CBMA 335]MUL70791.1 hypothetical protein [Mycolicibacterium sp. CBMA 311]MUL92983.1 hypothetical protein [Mycolicibacterium sp. CBMA 230]MUM14447.1 hypothetical protein [Mycolicibacterium sp. CBMA 293]